MAFRVEISTQVRTETPETTVQTTVLSSLHISEYEDMKGYG
jgi:hypothetical protein